MEVCFVDELTARESCFFRLGLLFSLPGRFSLLSAAGSEALLDADCFCDRRILSVTWLSSSSSSSLSSTWLDCFEEDVRRVCLFVFLVFGAIV